MLRNSKERFDYQSIRKKNLEKLLLVKDIRIEIGTTYFIRHFNLTHKVRLKLQIYKL